MRALTLLQPWAWAICHAGKRVENRTWPPPRYMLGQRFAVHAGLGWDNYEWKRLPDGSPWPQRSHCPRGAVVGVATLRGWFSTKSVLHYYDADENHANTNRLVNLPGDPWWMGGPVGWLLGDVAVLPEPIPCRGMLGLWELPDEVEREVVGQLTDTAQSVHPRSP